LSVDPILAVSGVREAVRSFGGRRLAVSPIVGGKALKGPAAKIMAELGYEVSVVGIADYYRDLCDTLLLDESDRGCASSIEERGLSAYSTGTVMRTLDEKIALAREILRIADAC